MNPLNSTCVCNLIFFCILTVLLLHESFMVLFSFFYYLFYVSFLDEAVFLCAADLLAMALL